MQELNKLLSELFSKKHEKLPKLFFIQKKGIIIFLLNFFSFKRFNIHN